MQALPALSLHACMCGESVCAYVCVCNGQVLLCAEGVMVNNLSGFEGQDYPLCFPRKVIIGFLCSDDVMA